MFLDVAKPKDIGQGKFFLDLAKLVIQAGFVGRQNRSAFADVLPDRRGLLIREDRHIGKDPQMELFQILQIQIEFRAETLNLSRLGKLAVDADRRTRKEAKEATWEFFDANQAEFDDLFDQLTRLRHQQGTCLGYDTYKQLAYKQMGRTQWGENEAARFRAQVAEYVVPLSNELREQQRRRLGLDKMLFYDQGVMDPEGNPSPQGNDDWVLSLIHI